jgi:hypothetical protein
MRVTITVAVLGVAGFALLLLEGIRALTGSSFSTLATTLLYLGMGLVALAGLGSAIMLWRRAA